MVCGRLFVSPALLLVLLHVCKPFRYVPLDPQTQKPYHYGTLENGIVGIDISWGRMPQWQYKRIDTKLNDNAGINVQDGHQNDRNREVMDTAMEDRRGLTKKPRQVSEDDEANQKVDELLKSSDTSFLKILKSTEFKVLLILSSSKILSCRTSFLFYNFLFTNLIMSGRCEYVCRVRVVHGGLRSYIPTMCSIHCYA